MTAGDLPLQQILSARAAQLSRPVEGGETAPDEQLIPKRAILIEEKNRLSRWPRARAGTRRLNFHQRDQTMDLRFARRKLRQHPSQTQRIFAKRGTHPVFTG